MPHWRSPLGLRQQARVWWVGILRAFQWKETGRPWELTPHKSRKELSWKFPHQTEGNFSPKKGNCLKLSQTARKDEQEGLQTLPARSLLSYSEGSPERRPGAREWWSMAELLLFPTYLPATQRNCVSYHLLKTVQYSLPSILSPIKKAFELQLPHPFFQPHILHSYLAHMYTNEIQMSFSY